MRAAGVAGLRDLHDGLGVRVGQGFGHGGSRWFNLAEERDRFDRNGDFVKFWLPELRDVPKDYIHCPWMLPPSSRPSYPSPPDTASKRTLEGSSGSEVAPDWYATTHAAKMETGETVSKGKQKGGISSKLRRGKGTLVKSNTGGDTDQWQEEPHFCYKFPPDIFPASMAVPSSPLFTVDGAVLDQRGRLKSVAYAGFLSQFKDEPRERAQHPHTASPGLRSDETWDLTQLRCWEDRKGAGWVAIGQGKSAWFSLTSWGSWRLALLMAKLQRDVWRKQKTEGGPEDEARPRKRRRCEAGQEKAEAENKDDPASAKGRGRGRGRPTGQRSKVPPDSPVGEDHADDKQERTAATVPPDSPVGEDHADDKQERTAATVPPDSDHADDKQEGTAATVPEKDEQDDEHKDANERGRLLSATVDDLPALAEEGLLVPLVRAKGWPFIWRPQWEGERWRKLLEDVQSGAVSHNELLSEVRQKLRRQVSGQKVASSRQHRERQAAEEQQRRQQAAAQLAAQLAAKRAREERMRAPEQVLTLSDIVSTEGRKAPKSPLATPAEKKVQKLAKYIETQPKAIQKTLWKRAMLRYHPDKATGNLAEGIANAEVFIEVKKKYDLFVHSH
eukprot:symbB.v1.2.014092.t1/scaffold1014.1/size144222/5